ncbi:transcriptional regulator, LysR family [Serratia sp. AS12]|uniref:LysR family transcriptional regulator n=1 Tax=Serratia TaxID=613 RepID=UPI00020E980A|nr:MULTISPECIES: LysR family transcriptional regulator [Serratia]AEF44641.1 transcriptional regulator, LysR family [Serratia plymuthica AS9]AEF49593.1 transcriptional regulator, LysR family [Serratia sp. AS12]AEG27300.1 transcriptional regulator, LysR family [Serratia sp. AS13]UTN98144.1 LysR substrate-binding domain-containing protein [Serratia plymuthica]
MDVLLAMRAFRRVVERNSFYKAAEDLAVTPAALSKQIKQLEARLATVLIARTTRTMSLTEAGQLYYQEACRLLGEFDALEQTVAASVQQVSGTLRINAPLSFGLMVLSPLLPQFMQRYPELQVELTLDDRVLDVVAAGFDISLRIRRHLPDSSLSARSLGEVQQRICAAPAYLAQYGTPKTVAQLQHHQCLAYSLAEKPGHWHFTLGEENLSVAVNPRLTANNSLMLRDMIGAGLGIGSLPSFVADPEIAAGRLVRLFPDFSSEAHQVFAVYPTRRHVQHKVRLFTDFIREAWFC